MSWRRLLMLQTAATLILLLGGAVTLSRLGHFLAVNQPPTSSDVIVVLGGEYKAFYRTQRAVELYRAGYAPLVVFSGGTLLGAGLACSSAQLSQEAALQLGLPPPAAQIIDDAQSTYDEAQHLRTLAHQAGWRSMTIITNAYHTRRAGQTFQALLPDVQLTVIAAMTPDYDPARWWQSETGLLAVINEVVKLAFYWSSYGISPF